MTARVQTVTILFTGLVGATQLLQRAGDVQHRDALRANRCPAGGK
jgi:class 3 adenylate cyclase